VRCWSGLWGRLSGREIPVSLDSAAQALLRSFECDLVDEDEIEPWWLTTLADPLNQGPVRPEVEAVARFVLE
jgi:acetoin utilization protein AcuC